MPSNQDHDSIEETEPAFSNENVNTKAGNEEEILDLSVKSCANNKTSQIHSSSNNKRKNKPTKSNDKLVEAEAVPNEVSAQAVTEQEKIDEDEEIIESTGETKEAALEGDETDEIGPEDDHINDEYLSNIDEEIGPVEANEEDYTSQMNDEHFDEEFTDNIEDEDEVSSQQFDETHNSNLMAFNLNLLAAKANLTEAAAKANLSQKLRKQINANESLQSIFASYQAANSKPSQNHKTTTNGVKTNTNKSAAGLQSTNGSILNTSATPAVAATTPGSKKQMRFQCKFCIYKSHSVSLMQNHIYRHIDTTPYSCFYCGHKSTTKSTIMVHIELCHPNMEVKIKESRVKEEDFYIDLNSSGSSSSASSSCSSNSTSSSLSCNSTQSNKFEIIADKCRVADGNSSSLNSSHTDNNVIVKTALKRKQNNLSEQDKSENGSFSDLSNTSNTPSSNANTANNTNSGSVTNALTSVLSFKSPSLVSNNSLPSTNSSLSSSSSSSSASSLCSSPSLSPTPLQKQQQEKQTEQQLKQIMIKSQAASAGLSEEHAELLQQSDANQNMEGRQNFLFLKAFCKEYNFNFFVYI
jgi:hypothetical protein